MVRCSSVKLRQRRGMGASTPKRFVSEFQIRGDFNANFSQDQIKVEPMFFNSSVDFAFEKGGQITRAFLSVLGSDWHGAVFDSRVHMLMPGWYPAIPGWHHDDVPRPKISVGQHFMTAGQPDYDNPRYHSEHMMGLVNGEICPTAFAVGRCEMPAIPEGELIYRRWHTEVESLIDKNEMKKVFVRSGELIGFDWQAFHTGTRAVKNGWRWFGRVSRNTERIDAITNEIRSQVQVYLEFPMEGW